MLFDIFSTEFIRIRLQGYPDSNVDVEECLDVKLVFLSPLPVCTRGTLERGKSLFQKLFSKWDFRVTGLD